MIALILSGLALAAAMADIVIHCVEHKRNIKRNAALVGYVDAGNNLAAKDLQGRWDEIQKDIQKLSDRTDALAKRMDDTLPDEAKAVEAKAAVDEFNQGLASLLNFDEMDYIRKRREEGEEG